MTLRFPTGPLAPAGFRPIGRLRRGLGGGGGLPGITIVNPGGEDGTTGWTVTSGGLAVRATGGALLPFEGSQFFWGGPNNFTVAQQNIEIPAAYLTAIDAGTATAAFSYQQASFASTDRGNINLNFLNASLVEIGNADSTQITISPAQTWVERTLNPTIPANTRYIQVQMVFQRIGGGTNLDCYFDGLTLDINT